MIFGALLLMFTGFLVFIPQGFAMLVFYVLPALFCSWILGEIILVVSAKDPEKGDYDFSGLPVLMAVLGFLVFVILRLFGFRYVDKKGALIVSGFGQSLYESYNSFNEAFTMFSPIFRPPTYLSVLYDDKSLLWTVAFSVIFGAPAVLSFLVHYRGHSFFSTRPGKLTRAMKELEKSSQSQSSELWRVKDHLEKLEKELAGKNLELSRLKEDFSVFKETGAPKEKRVASSAAEKPSTPAVDSDTL